MSFWLSVAIPIGGLLSALALFYGATDAYGKATWINNRNPNFDRDTKRRRNASRIGLLLIAVSFALQLYAAYIQR